MECVKWLIARIGAAVTAVARTMATGPVDTGPVDATTGDSVVQVRVSETYDLSTKVGKMGIVGIHTPTGSLIDRMWPGLIVQHKKFRFVKCDVAMACASMLPADPLQIGVEAGDIAPQDMFNPILYKAVSNDAMSNIQSFLQGYTGSSLESQVNQGSVVDVNDASFQDSGGDINQFDMYYALLANTDGFKKAMPQAGLSMRGLYPLVYQVVSNYGTNQSTFVSGTDAGSADLDYNDGVMYADRQLVALGQNISESGGGTITYPCVYNLRGPPMRMPAIDCLSWTSQGGQNTKIVPTSNVANITSNIGRVPPCYVGLIILPPAVLNQLYYRLKVTWTIEFTGLRSFTDVQNWSYLQYTGQVAYGSDYDTQSATMTSLTNLVDADGAEITKIMEGA